MRAEGKILIVISGNLHKSGPQLFEEIDLESQSVSQSIHQHIYPPGS